MHLLILKFSRFKNFLNINEYLKFAAEFQANLLISNFVKSIFACRFLKN
ncbi:hypothetical protein CAMRE0001_2145 [Campylobacter rectus RM3267]|uniref:Uncharacterized protein n=1 Tax=Campylobacter rectus RM3267 TaxID=553218 RepID=B9D449_CAMRE|nr:hypothetical protein CAMRE0001_2145 [Campylobacter rectus RM3267]